LTDDLGEVPLALRAHQVEEMRDLACGVLRALLPTQELGRDLDVLPPWLSADLARKQLLDGQSRIERGIDLAGRPRGRHDVAGEVARRMRPQIEIEGEGTMSQLRRRGEPGPRDSPVAV